MSRNDKKLSACESALISMVQQYCYDKEDAGAKSQTYSHNFMSAGENAFACLVNRGLAEWTDERHSTIVLTERARFPVRISPPSWLDYWWQEDEIKRLTNERDEARAWAIRRTRELQEMTAYADKLAAGLPMLPKDVEVIRQANWSMAEENNNLKRERDELRDMLGMLDVAKIAENIDKMREWLK